MTLLRRQYGIAEPVKRGMEMQIVRSGEMSAGFGMGGSAGVSSDILAGRDWGMEWEDVYTGELGGGMGGVWGEGAFHERMERGFGMGW